MQWKFECPGWLLKSSS